MHPVDLLAAASSSPSVNILSLNVTLVIEAAAFLVLLLLLSWLVYPPIIRAASRREVQITSALKEAEDARAKVRANALDMEQKLAAARQQARDSIGQAQRQAADAAETARDRARSTAQARVLAARQEVEAEASRVRGELQSQVRELVVAAGQRIARSGIDTATLSDLAGNGG